MSEDARKLRIQLETIHSMFNEMGGIQKVLADLTIIHDWVKRLEQLRQQMHSFERCSQTAEQKYLDVQRLMENKHEIRCELNQVLHSSKEIQKDCQQLKDEVDAKYQTMVSKIHELVTAEWTKHEKENNERIEGLRALVSGDIVNVKTDVRKQRVEVDDLIKRNHVFIQTQIEKLQDKLVEFCDYNNKRPTKVPQKSRKSPAKVPQKSRKSPAKVPQKFRKNRRRLK
ncbi:MAG: hypothetical protein HQM05_15370 [Magnetococcales bacterium]|nr:hypothetical protein [Magnetococcales bacterium]